VDFQLEAAYRQRLAEVGQAVKRRLVITALCLLPLQFSHQSVGSLVSGVQRYVKHAV